MLDIQDFNYVSVKAKTQQNNLVWDKSNGAKRQTPVTSPVKVMSCE